MTWLLSLIKIANILPVIEGMYNRFVDYLEDKKLIELGELRAYRESDIQSAIKKKMADDERRASIERLLIERDSRDSE